MNVLVNLNDVKDYELKKKEEENVFYNFKPTYSSVTDVSKMFMNCSNISTIAWEDLIASSNTNRKIELI